MILRLYSISYQAHPISYSTIRMEEKEDECLPPSPASLWCIANIDDEDSEARALESTTYVESHPYLLKSDPLASAKHRFFRIARINVFLWGINM